MKRVDWTLDAIEDLTAIAHRIALDDRAAALRVVTYIEDRALLLETSPYLGRAARREGLRELVLAKQPYILTYRVLDESVQILAVHHYRQRR